MINKNNLYIPITFYIYPTLRHVQQHLEVPGLDTAAMSTEELLFYYFKMMDTDQDAKLDGLELVASMIHYAGNMTWFVILTSLVV